MKEQKEHNMNVKTKQQRTTLRRASLEILSNLRALHSTNTDFGSLCHINNLICTHKTLPNLNFLQNF